jgi:hypothetical protein
MDKAAKLSAKFGATYREFSDHWSVALEQL